jgi:hypothetical protein
MLGSFFFEETVRVTAYLTSWRTLSYLASTCFLMRTVVFYTMVRHVSNFLDVSFPQKVDWTKKKCGMFIPFSRFNTFRMLPMGF